MEFIFIGICLIVSAVLLKKTRDLGNAEGAVANAGYSGEYFAVITLGLIIFLIGVLGLLWGTSTVSLDRRGIFTMFFVVSALNIQARLLNYSSNSRDGAIHLNRESSNGIDTLRKAYSIGFFPKSGSCVFLIHTTQVCQAILVTLAISF